MLEKQFKSDINAKKQSEELNLRKGKENNDIVSIEDIETSKKDASETSKNENFVHITNLGTSSRTIEIKQKKTNEIFTDKKEYKVIGKIDLDKKNRTIKRKKETEENKIVKKNEIKTEVTEPEKKKTPIEENKSKTLTNTPTEQIKAETIKDNKDLVSNKTEKKVVESKESKSVINKTEEKITDKKKEKEIINSSQEKKIVEETVAGEKNEKEVKVIGKINLDDINQKTRPDKKTRKQRNEERREKMQREASERRRKQKRNNTSVVPVNENEKTVEEKTTDKEQNDDFLETKVEKLTGPTVVGKINLPTAIKKKPVASSSEKPFKKKRKKRKRISKINVQENDLKNSENQNKQGQQKREPFQKQGQQKQGQQKQGQQKQGQQKQGQQKQGQQKQGQQKQGQQKQGQYRPKQQYSNQQTRNSKFWSQKKKKQTKKEVSEEDVQKQIKETLARLTSGKKKSNKAAKYRRTKRDLVNKKQQDDLEIQEKERKILKVTEFVTVNELANMMSASVTKIISTCMSLGLFVAINQRLDAETITLVAEEFGFEVEFVSVELQEAIEDVEDKEEELQPRAPIVTVMGHVDHGKTSLLDFIRSENVIAGEAGGITQHIGAYRVQVEGNKLITFLDTPGHEAFTAMRARGANVTDIAIIVIAADDCVMPQTVEAINHAQAADVPIIFAINKIDKPGANPEKIKEELANMNLLVEQWGGKYQSQDISAKHGKNIDALLEKILLEAEMLELQANPERRAIGSIIESSLDKGRGYVATILVQRGTLRVGDIILAGTCTGRIKAMYNERNAPILEVGPSEPVIILGLNGAPQAGDNFNIMESERGAREIAAKRDQLQREQGLRSQKHITLDEIGRRIAVGNFQELNVIIKGDVDGSIEALADSFIKLSTEEIQVNIKHKAVGQINEADIMLAAASNAVIVGFQVRPSIGARKLAEKEGLDIRLYSIIYDAINELKDAMQGMLAPETKEEILGVAEIRDVFKISKLGTIAGCIVKDGKILRNSKVRVIRDGIVVYTGELASLRRFKEDIKEVKSGFECGLNVEKFNDIKVGDMIEAFHEIHVERTL